MKYTNCIFDIDGTLIDTESTGILSLIRTVKELMGRDMPYEEAYPYFGVPSEKVGTMLGYEDNTRFHDLWEEYFVEMRQTLMRPFDGVVGMLKAVKAMELTTGVVTSRSHEEINHDPYLTDMLPYLDIIVSASDVERPKPYPDSCFRYMEIASERLGWAVKPQECIMFGDMEHDCSCCHGAGIDFALADWRGRGMQGIPAEYRFTDAAGILEILGI